MKLLRERLQHYGVTDIATADLVTLVFQSGGQSQKTLEKLSRLFAEYPTLPQLLQVEMGELLTNYELGTVAATKLQALFELARRLTLPHPAKKQRITSSFDAAQLLLPQMGHLDHEEMRVLVLDTKNQLVANVLLYQGTVNASVTRIAEIFRPAVTRKCPHIILCHNHPSGDVTASAEDIALTKQCAVAGNLLEIDLLDHLIIGQHRFTSLKEQLGSW
jgi:DNA repair protein RadC